MVMGLSESLSKLVNMFTLALPSWAQNFVSLFLLILVIVVYSVFVWKFYRFLGTKNILSLNLNKYNRSEHPIFTKFFALGFNLIEYIIILPFLIFFWFSIFAVLLIFLNESLTTSGVLIAAAAIVGSVRMISYYNESLAKEVAKFLPLTLLAVSILNPHFLNAERIFATLGEIPTLIGAAGIYLVFIIGIEILLRLFDFLFSILGINSEIETNKKE